MMMKKYGLITKVLLVSMFAILLSGCGNLLTSEFSSKANEAKFYTITGNIDVDAISAENSSRTGLPTIPSIDDNSINFSVFAKMGDKTITGEVSEMQYSITLPKGSWTITVIGKKAEVKVLEGSINVNPEEPTTQQTITLKIIKAGTGSLSLTISKEATLSCGGVKATLGNETAEYLIFNEGNNTIQWKKENIAVGSYPIKLDFYQKMTLNADGTYSCENLLYSHHDTVNIFANLVTNTWTGSGYSEDKTIFTLTQAMIANFAMTTFYVSNSGDDSKAGTYFAPFATMQKAVETINGINDGTSPYTIYVMNDITGTDSDFTDDNKALINVVPGENKSLNLKICGYNNTGVTIDANQKGRVMYIGKNANVTLQNLILTGGYLSDTKGGGIYSEGTCSLSSCTISENTAGEGGGVYVKDGTFTIENDALISKNTSCGNGGGVFAEGGYITINGGSISENIFSNGNYGGGGICLTGTAHLIMTGGKISNNYPKDKDLLNNTFGGGVYVSGGTFTMTGGEISGNSAYYGGGVAIIGTFSMSGGTISGNIVTNSSDGSEGNGSAVAVLTDGLFTVSESITINGDVYLFENQTITVSNNFEGGEVMITPYMYKSNDGVGVQVLKPIIDGESLTTEIVGKFAVTSQVEETINWTINANGFLSKETVYYVGNNENDNPQGTETSPFATLQAAVNMVNSINDGTSSYTIYVMNDITWEEDLSGTNNSSDFINITPTNSLNLKICGYNNQNVTINAQGKGRVMYIGENANVTLQNLILTGGHLVNTNSPAAAYRGAGLYILNSTAEVTIKNCEISENVIDNGYGAGLCVGYLADESLNLTIENSKISRNTIKHDSNGALSQAGAGIDIENVAVTLTITNSDISENVIDQNSCSSDKFYDYGVGLCLGNKATTIISGTAIKNNKIENAASNNKNAGGGVYLDGGTLTIQNSNENNTVISGNSSTIGGGVAVTTASSASTAGSFSMSGGTISGNIVTSSDGSEGNGSAVAVLTNGLFTVSESITIYGDVYLFDNQTITVSNDFEGGEVMITPYKYESNDGVGVQVLKPIEGTSLTTEIVGKFAVTPQVLSDGHEYWFIDPYGYLGKVPETKTNDDGTTIYLMESYDNLLYIARELKTGSITSFNIKLTNDIEIPRGKWQFNQLNVDAASTIDGQGHSITINEDVSSFDNAAGGLFYKFNNSTVKNLVLKGSITANTSAGGYIGALCRSAYRTTIQNVMSTVEINDIGSGNAGGLVGYFGGNGDKTTFAPATFIKNCAVYAKISSKNGTAGGLVGESWPNEQTWKIENCIYMGTVSSENGVAGALIGNENTGRTSYLTDIWYCESNGCAIFGKEGNAGNIEQSGVESKNDSEIASEDAAKLLNTNLDGTSNVVWEYVEEEAAYPILKSVN